MVPKPYLENRLPLSTLNLNYTCSFTNNLLSALFHEEELLSRGYTTTLALIDIFNESQISSSSSCCRLFQFYFCHCLCHFLQMDTMALLNIRGIEAISLQGSI